MLVVEDDPEIRFVVRQVLESEGYSVVEAENGQQAVSRIDQGLSPHLILLDLNMPVMDGKEFLSVRKSRPDMHSIPVIVITASMNEKAADGATAFLRKPPDLERLIALVQEHCLG